jgi:hypothetical protein
MLSSTAHSGYLGEPDELHLAQKYDQAIRILAEAISCGRADWTVWIATLMMALFEVGHVKTALAFAADFGRCLTKQIAAAWSRMRLVLLRL